MPISSTAISEVSISELPPAAGPPPAAGLLFPERRPVMIIGDDFFRAEMGVDFDGSPILVLLERTGWSITGARRDGSLIQDPSRVKLLREIWPVVRGETGTILNIYAGAQAKSPESTLIWQGPFPFVIGEDASVRPLVEGAFLAIRIQSLDQSPWSLLSIDLDLEPTGEVYDQ